MLEKLWDLAVAYTSAVCLSQTAGFGLMHKYSVFSLVFNVLRMTYNLACQIRGIIIGALEFTQIIDFSTYTSSSYTKMVWLNNNGARIGIEFILCKFIKIISKVILRSEC